MGGKPGLGLLFGYFSPKEFLAVADPVKSLDLMGTQPNPGAPTTYAPPAPPTAANAAAVQAGADARQKALEKQGLNATILGSAGASNGSNPGASLLQSVGQQQQQKNPLLGGG